MKWEYCDVPFCDELEEQEQEQEPIAAYCRNCTVLECGSPDLFQADYRGGINVTASGVSCQDWTVQVPHEHNNTPDAHPEAGLVDNSCRNPTGGPMAWCYTMDPQKR